ncbi:MAG: ABC transporter permease [Holophaga sp.]|jgi:ABC-2 type transport system permease protein
MRNPLATLLSLSPTRLLAQIRKELLCVLRDPKTRIALVGPPLMQLLIFAFANTLELKHADLAVFDRDRGPGAYELVARVGAASFCRQLRPVHSEAELAGLLERREILGGLVIPETFSRDLAAGRPARAQAILDGRRGNSSQILLGYLTQVAGTLGAELSQGPEVIDAVAVRHWFNPNLIYQWFVVPSLGGILVMFSTLMITGLSIARERELGTFDQLLVSPCTPLEIIVAKMAPALVICSVLGSVMVAAGILVFRVPFTGSFPLLLCSLLVFVLSMVGVGLMISSICRTQQQAILGIFTFGVPVVVMSGFATPIENMPVFLQWLSNVIPLKFYLVILQGSFLKALPVREVLANLWPMAVIGLATLSLATWFVKGRLE